MKKTERYQILCNIDTNTFATQRNTAAFKILRNSIVFHNRI